MQRRVRRRHWPIIGALLACAGGGAGAEDARRPVAGVPGESASTIGPGLSSARRAALEGAAAVVVSFLSGDADFEALDLADTVELYLAPEGGGARARLSREALRDRYAWRVGTGTTQHSFVPSGLVTKMTMRVGEHFNCRSYSLASRVPSLATRPHVGVRLEPQEVGSCLETWNATFVFDADTLRPRLIAAVYDQWEW